MLIALDADPQESISKIFLQYLDFMKGLKHKYLQHDILCRLNNYFTLYCTNNSAGFYCDYKGSYDKNTSTAL